MSNIGFFETIHGQAPGAWDSTEQTTPPPMDTGQKNANHLPYKHALSVQERSAAKLIISNQDVRADGDAVKLVDRVKGRKWILIKVPTSASVGIWLMQRSEDIIGPTGTGANPLPPGYPLAPTDPPLFLPTEAGIWAATQQIGSGTTVAIIEGLALDEFPAGN